MASTDIWTGDHGRVSQPVFLALQWTFTALSALFLVFRLTVRFRMNGRFLLDDFLVFVAWSLHLATTITWQVKSDTIYLFYAVNAGTVQWTPDLADRFNDLFRVLGVVSIMFYLGLWSIKMSFLVFFYRLGSRVKSHRIWWWVVFGFTVALGILSVADGNYKCCFNGWGFIIANCTNPYYSAWSMRVYYTNCAADVVSDILILTIPVLIVWRARITLGKKIVLMAVFSATLVDITIAIIRVAVVDLTQLIDNGSWVYFWWSIEAGTAIIIACTAAFRQLFITTQNQHLFGNPGSPPATQRGVMRLEWPRWPLSGLGARSRIWRMLTSRSRIGAQARSDSLQKNDGNWLIPPFNRVSGSEIGVEMAGFRVETGERVHGREQV
ncbi:uncharacterized protein BDV17DRAFT_221655 [Aspergillus undulatus]|uniref:uncharacterized protein n=1 Tax=Aspergillus undulatus TaxID=1810928 RepID=UPI003CCD0334